MNHRMGYPAIATWIAEEHQPDRKPQRTPVRVRLSEDAQEMRRKLDVCTQKTTEGKSTQGPTVGTPDADGWIAWGGGECPIPGKRFDVRIRSGREYYLCEPMETAAWLHSFDHRKSLDIIAYRLVEEAKESDEIKAGDLVEVIGGPSRIGIAKACERRPGHANPVLMINGRVYYANHLRFGSA